MSLDGLLSATRTASQVLDTHLRPYQEYAFNVAIACTAIWTLLRWLRTSCQQLCTTKLRGPPSESFLYVSESASSTPSTQVPYTKRGRRNMVPHTRSRRPWGIRGSSCVIPRRSLTDDDMTPWAIEDDVIPLSEPVRTKSGELVDSLTIAKGTLIAIPMECMNRSAAIWGDDAKVFLQSRWLEDANGQNGIPAKAKEIGEHRHLLTFVDDLRACLERTFP